METLRRGKEWTTSDPLAIAARERYLHDEEYREKIKEATRRWRAKSQAKKWFLEYSKTHREERNNAVYEWLERNPQYQMNYYWAHADQIRAQQRTYKRKKRSGEY